MGRRAKKRKKGDTKEHNNGRNIGGVETKALGD